MLSSKTLKVAAAILTTTTIACSSVFAANVKATTDVNVRSGPGNSYSIVTTMAKGTSAEKLGEDGNWIKVKVNGKTGYTYNKYLTTDDSSTAKDTVIKKVTITASSLNVRSGAGTSYSVLGTLKKNATAEVVAKSGDWYKIKYGKGYGYISAAYTKDSASTPAPTPSTIKKVTITASSLNVRSGAGTSYSVLGTLKKNATAEVVAKSGDWYKIKYGKGYGYISAAYTKDVASATKTVTITASSLNVRSGPGTSYKVIGGLNKGDKVTVVETSGSWYKIKFGKTYGYISSAYTK